MGLGTSKSAEENKETLQIILDLFPGAIEEASLPQGDALIAVVSSKLPEILETLKTDPRLAFDVLVDLTAVDYAERRPRFDLVYHLLSLERNRRLRVKVRVEEAQPEVASSTGLWSSADWLEREVWDMFGIRFTGHPNLKRILMYEGFEGHPLRKDYPTRKRQPLIGPKN